MKSYRKIFVLMLIILLLLPCIFLLNINVIAKETNNEIESTSIIQNVTKELLGDVSVKSVEYLYNLDDSPDYIYVKLEDKGYAIYSTQTLDLLEYSLDGDLPYSSNNKKYYAGPTHYIKKNNEKFENVTSCELLSDSEVKIIVEKSKNVLLKVETAVGKTRKNLFKNINLTTKNSYDVKNVDLLSNEEKLSFNSGNSNIPAEGLGIGATYIENCEYFLTGPYHGSNSSGTCSAVSVQLLLGYHNYYSDRRIIDEKYLFDGEDGPNTCANPMKVTSNILGTVGRNENGSDVKNSYFAKVVDVIPKHSGTEVQVSGINELLNERKNELSLSTDLAMITRSEDLSMIKNEIDNGRPIIISMRHDNYTNHSVVGYGYQTLSGTGYDEDDQFGYIVHYGWGKPGNWSYMSNVWINETWCYSWVKMEVSHTHQYGDATGTYFERKCSCGHRISEFPFTTSVSNGEVTILNANFESPQEFIIPSKINNYPVTSIASYAFSNHNNIENLKIPDTIKNIQLGAFTGCSSLKKISLPFIGGSRDEDDTYSNFGYIFGSLYYDGSVSTEQNGVTYYIPSSLEEVVVTNALSIKNRAFENCSILKEILLPYGVENIGDYAFSNCSSLKDISIPRTVTSIGTNAFYGCNKIINIVIPYSVTNIGANAFPSLTNIEWIYNPSVTASMLGITTNLVSVEVQSGVSNINSEAFSNCLNLSNVELYENVSSISSTAFDKCASLKSVTWYYNSGHTVDSLGGGLNNLVTKIIVPLGVTKIENNAFLNCTNLKSVVISESVFMMGDNVFLGCTSLDSLAWYYNPEVTARELKIEDLLTKVSFVEELEAYYDNEIAQNAFIGCTKLLELNIPKYITGIYEIVDSKITGVDLSFVPENTNIVLNLPENLDDSEITIVGKGVFKGCERLIEVNMPQSITDIESNAFENCTNLSSIKLSLSLKSIGNEAFKGCSSLETISIPKGIVAIESSVFEDCVNLSSIVLNLATSLTRIGTSAFKGCTNLTTINLPNSVTNIESNAFENCLSLNSVKLSENLITIDYSAFKNCVSIEVITIPFCVQYINSEVFKNCSSLSNVNILRDIDDLTILGVNTFAECSSMLQIKVPLNRIAEYKNMLNWNDYSSKIVSDSDNFSKYNLNCYSNFILSTNLIEKNKKIYKLNVECPKNYKIISDADFQIEINLYDSNMNLIITSYDIITMYLKKGIYYVDLKFVSKNHCGDINLSISLTYPVDAYSVINGENNIIEHLHENNDNSFNTKLKYNCSEKGLFKITLIAITSLEEITYPDSSIIIYNDSTREQLAIRLSTDYFILEGYSSELCNNLIVFLNQGCTYFIDINIPSNLYSSVRLKIEKIEDIKEVNMFNYVEGEYEEEVILNEDISNYGDFIKKIEINQDGIYDISYEHNGPQSEETLFGQENPQYLYYVFYKEKLGPPEEKGDLELILPHMSTIVGNSITFELTLEKGIYYIGYYNKLNYEPMSISIKYNVDEYSTNYIISDPAPVNSCGTMINIYEKNIDNKSFGGNQIVVGFTRILYFDPILEVESRTDFNWYSNNEEIATISQFGTIFAKSIGEVQIMAVNIDNPRIVYTKTFYVINDTSEDNAEQIIYSSDTHNVSDGVYQIKLTAQNCPYPSIYLYNWEIIYYDKTITDIEDLGYGYYNFQGYGQVIIKGNYYYNNKYSVQIHLNVD